MALFIRMVIYMLASGLAGYGFAELQDNQLTINLDQLAAVIGGLVTVGATFWTGRVAKRNGGLT